MSGGQTWVDEFRSSRSQIGSERAAAAVARASAAVGGGACARARTRRNRAAVRPPSRPAAPSGARLLRDAVLGVLLLAACRSRPATCSSTSSGTYPESPARTTDLTGCSPAHRTSSLTEASLIGSIAAGGVVLPIIAAVTGALAALFRKWRIAAFAVFALVVRVLGLSRHDARLPRASPARPPARAATG